VIVFKELGNMGRMGNSLFQIAATIGLATKYGHSYSFPEWKYQDYFINKLPVYNNEPITHTLIEPSFSYHDFNIADLPKDAVININGYLQSWKYFSHCEDLIREQFAFNHKRRKMTAIHVRRTDYLKVPDYHYNLPMEYYYRAMDMSGDNLFMVFSDDIEWCKQQDWKTSYIYFSEASDEKNDFFTMASSTNNIICNSSFSFWASWLNANPEKMVIAPEKFYWFGKYGRHNDVSDLYLPSWKIVNL